MELYMIAGVAALAALAAAAVVRRRRRRTRRASRRGSDQDAHVTWVEDLTRQVANHHQDDDTQPWSRHQ